MGTLDIPDHIYNNLVNRVIEHARAKVVNAATLKAFLATGFPVACTLSMKIEDGTVVANSSKSQQLCVTNLGFDEKARVFDDQLVDELFDGLLDTEKKNQS